MRSTREQRAPPRPKLIPVLEQQLVNGISLGSTYALVGVAFTLIIGTLGMLNIAVGEVFMLGAFFSLSLLRLGAPFPAALAVGMLGGGMVSLVIERLAFRPLRHAPILMPFLSSIGFSILLQNVAANVWGTEPTRYPDVLGTFDLTLGTIRLSSAHLVTFGTALALVIVLEVVIWRTRLGRGMRAVAEDHEVASILGVEPDFVIPATFFVSGLMAGAAGALVGVAISSVTTSMGVDIALKGVAAMVVGGLGNLRGALLGGVVLGLTEVLSVAYLGASYRELTVFGLLLLILVARPQGLLGSQMYQPERG